MEKPKFPFQVVGTLVIIFDTVGLGAGGRQDGGVGHLGWDSKRGDGVPD